MAIGGVHMTELRQYTQNRNHATEQETVDAQHPGWFAARSLDGLRTYGYGETVAELREILAALQLMFSEVVIEQIDSAFGDPLACRESGMKENADYGGGFDANEQVTPELGRAES